MKKILILASLLLVISASLFAVAPVHDAQAQQFPGNIGNGIVPCGDSINDQCTACDLTLLTQNIINFGVFLTGFVAVLLFVYAGFLYVTAGGSSDQIGRAHTVFRKVFVGMIIVLIAWLVVDTIMKTLFSGSDLQGGFGPCNSILCESGFRVAPIGGGDEFGPGEGSGTGSGSGTGTGGAVPVEDNSVPAPRATPILDSETYGHAEATQLLAAGGIQISSTGNCSNQNNQLCTSFEGVRQPTVDTIIELQNACNCGTMTISGGTETGHETGGTFTHGNGYKVDISKRSSSPELSQYIAEEWGKHSRDPDFGNGPFLYRFLTPDSQVTVRSEGTHWDIQVIPLDRTP